MSEADAGSFLGIMLGMLVALLIGKKMVDSWDETPKPPSKGV